MNSDGTGGTSQVCVWKEVMRAESHLRSIILLQSTWNQNAADSFMSLLAGVNTVLSPSWMLFSQLPNGRPTTTQWPCCARLKAWHWCWPQILRLSRTGRLCLKSQRRTGGHLAFRKDAEYASSGYHNNNWNKSKAENFGRQRDGSQNEQIIQWEDAN